MLGVLLYTDMGRKVTSIGLAARYAAYMGGVPVSRNILPLVLSWDSDYTRIESAEKGVGCASLDSLAAGSMSAWVQISSGRSGYRSL